MEDQLRAIQPRRIPHHDATRASLLLRVRDWSDDASWQEFFEVYWKLIYAVAIKAGLTEAEAEDIVQGTMMSVANNIRTFDYKPEVGSFRKWVCSQARWKIQDQLRRQRRDGAIFHPFLGHGSGPNGTPTMEHLPEPVDAHGERLEKEWDQAVLERALEEVKNLVQLKHYQIFDLCVIKKWPPQQVAKTLRVNLPQVYLVKSRVASILKEQIRMVEAQMDKFPVNIKNTKLTKTHP